MVLILRLGDEGVGVVGSGLDGACKLPSARPLLGDRLRRRARDCWLRRPPAALEAAVATAMQRADGLRRRADERGFRTG